jgi:hypothetical protein
MPEYLPTLRLAFPGGVFNEYRLSDNRQVEFRISDGEWRALNATEVELHYVLHTEVSKWLGRVLDNAKRTGDG